MPKRKIAFFALFLVLAGFTGNHSTTPYPFPRLAFFPEMPLSEANPVTIEGVDLGRHLFYDPVLSSDSTLSCASCHRQEKAFSDATKKFSNGINGEFLERNTPPLFNLAWHPALFWDGKVISIEEQVFHPVRAHNEMNLQWKAATNRIRQSKFYTSKFRAAFGDQTIDSVLIAKAIGQFERALLSNRSKYDQVLEGKSQFTKEEYDGFVLVNDMTKGDCLHCHTTDADALGSTFAFSNNGLDPVFNPLDYKDKGKGAVTGDLRDYGKFKIPSLRNIAFTAPYMHDGRFSKLEEVLNFYIEGVNLSINIDSKMGLAHQKGVNLSSIEKQKIIAFLMTLSDSAFISDPAFGNPFLK